MLEQSHQKNHEADYQGTDPEDMPRLPQFALKRGLRSGLASDQMRDMPHLCIHARRYNSPPAVTRGNRCGRKQKIVPVTQRGCFWINFIGRFVGREAFSSQSAFFNFKINRPGYAQVSRDKVAGFQHHQIARHQMRGWNNLFLALPNDPRLRTGKFFKCFQSLFCLAFLHHARNGIDNDNGQNNYGIYVVPIMLQIRRDKRNSRRYKQDYNHKIGKLCKKARQQTLFWG